MNGGGIIENVWLEVRASSNAVSRPRARQFDDSIERGLAGDKRQRLRQQPGNSTVRRGTIPSRAPRSRAEAEHVREQAVAKIESVDRVGRRVGGEKTPVVRPRHRVGSAEFARSQGLTGP